jgi:thioredoxin reductase
LERLTGAGVFYGAAGVEAPAMAGEEVYVVGGANSAGQAALHLATFAKRVTLLVRGVGEGWSRTTTGRGRPPSVAPTLGTLHP